MRIYDRLSNMGPRSLASLDRAIHRVFGEHLFSEEELRSLSDATTANRKARIKTKLQLKYSDSSKLHAVQRILLFNKIRRAVLVSISVAVIGLSVAYLVFLQLPRAYTIGHDIRLDPTEVSSISLRTLNLYIPKTNAGTEEAVESMLYNGPAGAKALLTSDEFIPWLLRRSDTYTTDSANITTDATIRDAYRAFFSDFIGLTDTSQASSVRYLDIAARKTIFEYLLTKDVHAGAVLASLSGQMNNFRRNCNISGAPIPNTCLLPFYIDLREGGEVRYFISLRKDGVRSNIVISRSGKNLQTLDFKYRAPDGGVLDEKREIIWVSRSCSCLPNVPQYFVDPNLFVVWDGDLPTYVQAKIQQ